MRMTHKLGLAPVLLLLCSACAMDAPEWVTPAAWERCNGERCATGDYCVLQIDRGYHGCCDPDGDDPDAQLADGTLCEMRDYE